MKRFIAFLFAIVMLTIGKPMFLYAQEHDTTMPAVPMPDTTKAATPATADTGNKVSPVKPAIQTSVKTGEITDRIQNKEKAAPKKHWNLLYRIHMIGHKKRERRAYINQGHHEFYLRTRRDQKRISRHHLNPYKPTKSSKKMQKKIQHAFNKKDKATNKREKDNEAPPAEETPKAKDESGKQEETEKPKENKDAPKSDNDKPKEDTTKPKLFYY